VVHSAIFELEACLSAKDIQAHIRSKRYFEEQGYHLKDSRIIFATGVFVYTASPELEAVYDNGGLTALEAIIEEAREQGLSNSGREAQLRSLRQQGLNIKFERRGSLAPREYFW